MLKKVLDLQTVGFLALKNETIMISFLSGLIRGNITNDGAESKAPRPCLPPACR